MDGRLDGWMDGYLKENKNTIKLKDTIFTKTCVKKSLSNDHLDDDDIRTLILISLQSDTLC